MFYYKLLVVLTIATIGLSIPVTKSLNEPERCCVPKQFSSKVVISMGSVLPDGKTFVFYAHLNLSSDQTRGMVGMRGISYNIPDGQQTNIRIIENNKDGQTYTIDVDTKHCEKSTIAFKPMDCIPETATFIESLTYGYGDKQIIGDTWLIKINETITYSTVSRGDCVPFGGNIFIPQLKLVDSYTMTNFAPRIDDPSIFDIPAECQKLI